jgi:hypothetical protein
MKRVLIAVSLIALGVGASVPASAATADKSGTIVIRHQEKGCHTWSLNGGPSKVSLDLRLARGATVRIENIDPMVHQLIQKAGPAVAMRTVAHNHMTMVGLHKITGRGVMNHMGAALKVTFPHMGVYRFTTEDLGDYFELKTMGKVNELKLVVRVS